MKIITVIFLFTFSYMTVYSLTSEYINAYHKIEIKISSSENGYSIQPENIYLRNQNNEDFTKYIISGININYTTFLPPGTYFLSVYKNGFLSCETYFSINQQDIKYHLYLDPINKNQLFSEQRIKQLLKQDYAYLAGYIVNDETGEPLSGVNITHKNSNIKSVSNVNGFYELYLPASCDYRNISELYFTKTGFDIKSYDNFEIYPNTDLILTVRLKPNTFTELPGSDYTSYGNNINDCIECNKKNFSPNPFVSGFVLPLNIRVGRNCTGTSCTYAEVYSVETYCKYVLPAEVYACWGNLSGGMNSLQACAVAVRTYGIYYVYNPINPSLYDICDNTYCQYMGNVTSTNTNNAVDNTYRYILTNSSGVVRCEYSAENNNKGCGNGYSGTGTSWPCIYDPVCLNSTPNGHGRGLCQWGTIRWATGTIVTASSPCSPGAPHSYGVKNWQQILDHYYNVLPYNWTATQGITATINSSICVPSSANPCSTITITSNVNVTNTVSLMIGASVAPSGTSNWISDPAHDIKVNFSQGTANYNRLFTIPCQTQPGNYDLLTAIWYDKDNNNQINQGDFVVHSKLTPNALVISPTGIETINSEVPQRYELYQNYPNPFNSTTIIRFDLPEDSYAVLKLYNSSGKEVLNPVNKNLTAGKYKTEIDLMQFPSGVYFYRLTFYSDNNMSNKFTDTKKLILVK